ncbi:MAG TPA: acyl-CoA reductase C-terminal domain-containing protein, partial [Anaerolineales bacterium]|nr:acyl-CoA reductase C-terminal domain-containing protein [Anaerolineales bacterium]
GTFLGIMGAAKVALTAISWCRKLLGMNETFALQDAFNTTHTLAVVFSFYTSPSYTFHNKKLQQLEARLGDLDRRMFSTDPRQINWKQYMGHIHLTGLNRYALKDKRRTKAAVRNAAAQGPATIAPAAR